MRILLLSAYDAGSHRYWRQSLVTQFPEHEWVSLSLPARHFNWRVRGNPLSWLAEASDVLGARYDLLLATSMVDLATLRGLVPSLSAVTAVLYVHENQFAYPDQAGQQGQLEAQMVSLYSALAADRILFNSAYNRDTFLAGVNALLKRLPDHRPLRIEPLLAEKISLLPVPLADVAPDCQGRSKRFTVTWNHRWEYDKGPDRLLRLVEVLETRPIDYQLMLLGERFRRVPRVFDQLLQRFGHRIGHCGYVESRSEYLRLLSESTLVLSTALHEFQGISLMEATAAGARPRAPERLSYPEFLPTECLYPSCEDAEQEAVGLADRIEQDFQAWRQGCLPTAPNMTPYRWSSLKGDYARALFGA